MRPHVKSAGLALLVVTGTSWAQVAEEPRPDPESREAAEPRKPALDAKAVEVPEVDTGAGQALRPPPEAPKPADQAPSPYLQAPPPATALRNVEVGPHIGLWWRSSESDSVTYGPDLAYGADVRVNLIQWFGVRGIVTRTTPPVTVQGGLGAADEVDQPDLGITLLALRLEPSYLVTPRVRLFGGPEVGWARVVAPRPETRPELDTAERKGVIVELALAAGVSAELIERWLVASLNLRAGLVTTQTGQLFQRLQSIDETGRMVWLDALPKFGGSLAGLIGVELLL